MKKQANVYLQHEPNAEWQHMWVNLDLNQISFPHTLFRLHTFSIPNVKAPIYYSMVMIKLWRFWINTRTQEET